MKISKCKATAESKGFPRITAGTRVNVLNKSQGVVRYIGCVNSQESTWIGVELDETKGENDGTVDKRWYFKCNEQRGIFVRPDSIQIIEEKKKPGVTSINTNKQSTGANTSATSKISAGVKKKYWRENNSQRTAGKN